MNLSSLSEEFVAFFQKLAAGSAPRSPGEYQEPLIVAVLKTVNEQRPVFLVEDVLADLDHEIRKDSQNVGVKAAWWSLHRARPFDTQGSPFGCPSGRMWEASSNSAWRSLQIAQHCR